MRQITIAIDQRHAAAMGCTTDRIRDAEMRGLFATLARLGRHDIVLRINVRAEMAVRTRIMDRHNRAELGVA